MFISIDLHGVIDSNPEKFEEYAKELTEDGHDVYILTGSSYVDAIEELSKLKFDLQYITDILSITDILIDRGYDWEYDKWGRPSFDAKIWWYAKGNIAKEYNIDLHIDDRYEFCSSFTTPFALYKKNKLIIEL